MMHDDHQESESATPALSNQVAVMARLRHTVFDGQEPIVVALKGGWGEGKTHFWQQVVTPAHPEASIGYVSLFGADSLQDIREKVVLAAKLSQDIENLSDRLLHHLSESIQYLPDRVGKPINKSIQSFTRSLKTAKRHLPAFASKYGIPASLFTQILEEELLQPGMVLCLDDLERLSKKKIPADTLLGYITELRDRRGMKVVLIYNQDKVENDFRIYQEKVIDKEIPYAPDTEEVLQLVFGNEPRIGQRPPVLAELKRCFQVLGLRNIRLINKIRQYYEDIVFVLPDSPSETFLNQALYSLTLFVWIRFAHDAENQPSFEFLCNESVFFKHFGDDPFQDNAHEDEHAEVRKLLAEYDYRHTDDLDKLLMAFVQTDILDVPALNEEYERYIHNESRGLLQDRYKSVWHQHYHQTLQDTEEIFCNELIAAATDYIEYIPLHNLDEALLILCKLDRETASKALLDSFVEKQAENIAKFNRSDLFESLQHPGLNAVLETAEKIAKVDNRPIGEVIDSAVEGDFIYQDDRERLAQFNSQDYVAYFTAHDQKYLTSKLRKLGTITSRIANPDPLELQIQEKVREAATEIAGMNRMNRLRMESMGLIEVEGSDGPS